MMIINQNIHPTNGKWKSVKIYVHGAGQGSCVNFDLDYNTFSFHYGSEENKNEFILKLKEAINSLPME